MQQSSQVHLSFRIVFAVGVLLAIIGGVLSAHQPARAEVVSGYSEYYLPGNARQLLLLLDDNETDNLSASTLTNITTIAAGGDVVIYYDHWENGYLNGAAGDEVYTATKGSILTFKSTNIPTTAFTHTLTACTGSTFPAGGGPGGNATRCYDGQDRIYVVGAAVSVAQSFWPTAADTNYANAWEVYPIKPYQQNYTIPVGEDLCTGTCPSATTMADFDHVYVIAQATYSGTTTIQIDNPATAGVEVSKTLNRGETTELWHVNSGTLVTGSHPIQVQFIIGEDTVNAGQNNSRSYTAVPSSLWSWHYYSPVPSNPTIGGVSPDADVFIYNPTTATLSLNYEVITGTGTFTVAAKSTESFRANSGFYVPVGSALYLEAANKATKFWAIGGYDVHDPTYNWGYSLIPVETLTNEYYASWAPGGWNQAAPGSAQNSSYSPFFVTPVQDNTTIFVDYSPVDGTVDATYTLNRLETQKIFDSKDADNTGTHIWATGPFAITWGEDAATSAAAAPGLDAGYTILPFNRNWVDIVLGLDKTASPDVIATAAGQTSLFMLAGNGGAYGVNAIQVLDQLPANWAYITNTTVITLPTGSVITTNPTINGQNLLWTKFPSANLDMGPNQYLTITFRAQTTAVLPVGVIENQGLITGTVGANTFSASDSVPIYISGLALKKTSSAGGSINPGGTITYTMVVSNVGGGGMQNNVGITDSIPAGTSFVTGTISSRVEYLDDFNTGGGYNQSAGVSPWASTPWIESGDNGNPATGKILIANNALTMTNAAGASISRTIPVNLTGKPVFLDLTYREIGDLAATDIFSVEVYNGTIWTPVITKANDFGGPLVQSLNISALANANTAIRFVSTYGAGKAVEIDHVRISYYSGSTFINPPPTVLPVSTSYDLASGQSLTLTYVITVNNPTAAASVINTAYAQSTEFPNPLPSTTTDILPPAGVGNYVWLDLNGNGVQDAGEPGLVGVTVQLYTSAGALLSTTTTITNGAYTFAGVTPGSYYLRFATPPGYSVTRQDQGGNDATDSDTNPATGQTATFTLYSTVTDTSRDAGFLPAPGAVGDYVWVDENGDGVQDAGEPGIPNASVTLTGADIFGNPINLTTTTDADGKYLFSGVQAGSYTVTVNSTTLPAGLAANPTYDYDGVSSAHKATVTVLPGQEMMLADFGYNWAPATDTDNNTGTGTIGDRLWIDANGDGRQDPGEAGLAGVSVALLTAGPDGLFGTTDDVTATITTTNAAGNYIFDGLAAGAYVVRVNGGSALPGYTQKGDPDQSGTACTTCDQRTTTPIVLAPGDVYVNADFGYQPSGVTNTIGNQIFVDANGNGKLDGGELGIPGVSVALLDASGNVIATTLTDVNGQYGFPGLSNGTYTVWVNDTANVLGGLTQHSTPNNAIDGGQSCGTCNGRNTVTVSGSGNSFQDFGYAPANHATGNGLIGDTIFLDRDGGNDYDPGEGLEGVRVDLYQDVNNNNLWDAGDVLLSSAWSSENGSYYFGGLAAGEYVVKVYTPTLPTGVTNTVDPDTANPGDSQSAVTLGPGGVNLLQDFGYRDTSSPNTIGGTIWNDTNADGTLAAEAGRFMSITVVLYDSNSNIIATTSTDASGVYTFTNLPDGTFRVDVTDDANRLDGYWHSTGPSAGTDNNSQADPYTVTVSNGQTNTTADFGYYRNPATLGNFVWLDRNNNGVQEASEPGIAGVKVTLTITYPNGTLTTITTLTDVSGFYSFGNLLLDEDFDGVGAGEPTFSISVTAPASTSAAPQDQGGNDNLDSDNSTGQSAAVLKGTTNNSYDFGFYTTRFDLGDAPDAYKTLFPLGAAHIVFPDGGDGKPDTTNGIPAVWLGATVDVEPDGQPSVDAKGDGADENGLTFKPSGWLAGQTSIITVTINASQNSVTVYYGLWIDWNQDNVFEAFYAGSGVSGSGPVAVPVNVSVPVTYTANTPVYFRVRVSDAPLTSVDWAGTRVNGEVEDYQLKFSSTAVTLASFTAAQAGNHNEIAWETASELRNLGFNLWRGPTAAGPTEKLNAYLIPSQAPGGTQGFTYTYEDASIVNGATYYYWLEDVDLDGTVTRHGPVSTASTGGSPSAVRLTSLTAAAPSTAAVWPLIGLGLLAALGVGAVVLSRRRIRR